MFLHITHILLDAARMGTQMSEAKTRNRVHESLYTGSMEQLSGVAPHLFQATYGTSFVNWYLKKGWGDSWGLLFKSSWPLSELHKHFRKFLLVKTEGGNSLYFRFYDPRVLRIFLPTCDTAQLREFFGNGAIDYFIMEGEDPAFALRIWHENGFLKTERFPAADMIAALPEPVPLEQPTAKDELLPETLAVIAGLREKHPGVVFPGEEQDRKHDSETVLQPQPQSRAPAAKPVPDEQSAEVRSDKAADVPPPSGPKTMWKLFD